MIGIGISPQLANRVRIPTPLNGPLKNNVVGWWPLVGPTYHADTSEAAIAGLDTWTVSAGWTRSAIDDPFGGTAAYRYTENTATTNHRTYNTSTNFVIAPVAFDFWARRATRDWMNASTNGTINSIDLLTKSSGIATPNSTAALIEELSDWQHWRAIARMSISGPNYFLMTFIADGGGDVYTGNGLVGIDLYLDPSLNLRQIRAAQVVDYSPTGGADLAQANPANQPLYGVDAWLPEASANGHAILLSESGRNASLNTTSAKLVTAGGLLAGTDPNFAIAGISRIGSSGTLRLYSAVPTNDILRTDGTNVYYDREGSTAALGSGLGAAFSSLVAWELIRIGGTGGLYLNGALAATAAAPTGPGVAPTTLYGLGNPQTATQGAHGGLVAYSVPTGWSAAQMHTAMWPSLRREARELGVAV